MKGAIGKGAQGRMASEEQCEKGDGMMSCCPAGSIRIQLPREQGTVTCPHAWPCTCPEGGAQETANVGCIRSTHASFLVVISETLPSKSYHTSLLPENASVTSHHARWHPKLPTPRAWPSLLTRMAVLFREHTNSPAQSLHTEQASPLPNPSGLSCKFHFPDTFPPSLCPFSNAQMKK